MGPAFRLEATRLRPCAPPFQPEAPAFFLHSHSVEVSGGLTAAQSNPTFAAPPTVSSAPYRIAATANAY